MKALEGLTTAGRLSLESAASEAPLRAGVYCPAAGFEILPMACQRRKEDHRLAPMRGLCQEACPHAGQSSGPQGHSLSQEQSMPTIGAAEMKRRRALVAERFPRHPPIPPEYHISRNGIVRQGQNRKIPCPTCNARWINAFGRVLQCRACYIASRRQNASAGQPCSQAIGSAATVGAVPVLIREECDALADMLIAKNRAYGNSALEPVRVFSKASTEEQIRVRLDDKLSRLMRGDAAGEDVELDLLGYLILLRVYRRMAAAKAGREAAR